MENSIKEYNLWVSQNELDDETRAELASMRWDTDRIYDAFHKSLRFGTSGLRGIMGAGTNRINRYIVRKVTQGVASYIKKNFSDPSFVIAYDCRKNSREFAQEAAGVMAANGIPVYIFEQMAPVSLLSFAVKRLGASLGLMITASHNSREYNGYKVYSSEGYQITDAASEAILAECEQIDTFSDVSYMEFDEALKWSICTYIDEAVCEEFIQSILSLKLTDISSSNIKVVYTPLYGAGFRFVKTVLERAGLKNLYIVENQVEHDGDFPTCPYPNPEREAVYEQAISRAEEIDADLIIVTDPDGDRTGVAVKTEGGYRILTGNEIGILMFNYICRNRKHIKKGYVFKSLVSTPLIDTIARKHRLQVKTTLTGFKYIGEGITALEDKKKFVFGFEESNGYLIGSYCRDKDGIGAAMSAVEMAVYYKNIIAALEKIYKKYGYCSSDAFSFEDNGSGGDNRISSIMDRLRAGEAGFDAKITDYRDGAEGLPAADILRYCFNDGSIVYIRPSGTEPKLKAYIFAQGKSVADSEAMCSKTKQQLRETIEVLANPKTEDQNGNKQ